MNINEVLEKVENQFKQCYMEALKENQVLIGEITEMLDCYKKRAVNTLICFKY